MLTFPNAKINLGLNIVSKRPDGYHNLESCFYPIPWCDVLEIIASDELKFTSTGLSIPGAVSSNLCMQAFHLLKEAHRLPNVHIHLHKVIPMGAGLGGGSADGAFALKMLNELFDLNLSISDLQRFATQLGSDCPFFIENTPVLATGTGTNFTALNLNLSEKYIALKNPEIHISTQEAYSQIVPTSSDHYIPDLLSSPINEWKKKLKNDFEYSVFPKYPAILALKEWFYEKGASYASMSGSGSTVFGIFDHLPELESCHIFKLS